MEEQYQATKAKIAALEIQMKQHLSDEDWNELSSTLDRKYKSAVQSQVQKAQKLYPKDRKIAQPKRKGNKAPQAHNRPGQVTRPKRGDDLSSLARLLVNEFKKLKN